MLTLEKHLSKLTSILIFILILIAPGVVSAHQPRIPVGDTTIVIEPEISKAYYTKLAGSPQTYTISSDIPFALYVNLLVPDITGQKQDISLQIFQDGNIEKPFLLLDGPTFLWTKMFEPFGYDTYWKGPEYKASVPAGKYDIIVSSTDNESKYSLAIGETENFDVGEIMNALTLVPKIKRDFFGESPISFIFSPFGWGLIVVIYLLALIFGLAYRFLILRYARRSTRTHAKNIGTPDRIIRAVIGLALLILAITTSWSPLLLFFSGFAFFEAIWSWCGLYAALGRDTCLLSISGR